ncbi:hypothetical protein EBR78_06260 [bacterium]|nr:hypothetical protein [bacterium]NBX83924.1 hypothetical protein [bacterium]
MGLVFVSILIWVSNFALASVPELFESNFSKNYSQGLCKQNALKFLGDMSREGHSLEGFRLVKIENKGIGTFGLVNAEKARSWMKGVPVTEEKNWYEHWIVLSDAGTVYDFDFTTEPTPTFFEQYVEAMFLNEPECGEPASLELCGRREDKLADYVLTVYEGESVNRGQQAPVWNGTLAEAIYTF